MPLTTETPKFVSIPALYHSHTTRATTDLVCWHATAGASAMSSIGWINRKLAPDDKTGKLSYHIIIERDGTVYSLVPLWLPAYHAGESAWPYPDGKALNYRSIGIAFANWQVKPTDPKFEKITDAQIESACFIQRNILGFLYPNLRERSSHVRHRDVSPGRRNDPTPETLDWNAFLDRITE